MKVFKIVLIIVIVLLLIIAGGVYFFIHNLDLNKYKNQIAQQLGSALHTDVSIGDIDFKFGFKTGLSLNVQDIKLADKGLLAGVGITVDEVNFAVSLGKFFKERTLVIEAIDLREPIIHYNMIKKRQSDMADQNNFGKDKAVKNVYPHEKNDFLRNLQINTIRISKGEIVIAKDDQLLAQDLEIKGIGVVIEDLVLGQEGKTANGAPLTFKPFSFHAECSALGSKQLVTLAGKGRIDIKAQQMRLDDVNIQSDLSQISLDLLSKIIIPVKAVGLQDLKGIINTTITQMIFGPNGIPVLTLNSSWTNGEIAAKALPVSLQDINFSAEYSDNNLDVLESHFGIAGGEVSFKGRLEDVVRTQLYQLDVTLENINPILLVPKDLLSGIEFSGKLNGSGKFTGGGLLFPDFVKNLSGDLSFTILDGRLENFNVLNFIMSKISFIPDLAERVAQAIPEEYRKRMESNKTIFDEISLRTHIDKGVISYNTLFSADTGRIDATGSLNWKQNFIFNGKFAIPASMAKPLVADVHDLSVLVDDQSGEVVIPLKSYQGPLNQFKPSPDMEYLSKTIIVSKAKDEVKGLLKKVISGGDTGSQEAPSDAGQGAEQKKTTGPDIVDTIFDSIFK